MQELIYNSPNELKTFLEIHGLGMQKKFGQNFLIDENIRQLLIKQAGINKNMSVWEIGPGLGAMTSLLLNTGAKITAFEIDRGFITLLKDFFSNKKNFTLIEGDVLKTWKEAYKNFGKPDCFFGNLPYNIAAILIANTIEAEVIFDKCLVTVQKEVGKRMTSNIGGDYSSFSVLCQTFYDVNPIKTIPPQAFWPKPNIDSQAVLLTKKSADTNIIDHQIFFSLVRGLFFSRRKTIKNNLSNWLKTVNINYTANDILKHLELNEKLRAENLTPNDFINIANFIIQI